MTKEEAMGKARALCDEKKCPVIVIHDEIQKAFHPVVVTHNQIIHAEKMHAHGRFNLIKGGPSENI